MPVLIEVSGKTSRVISGASISERTWINLKIPEAFRPEALSQNYDQASDGSTIKSQWDACLDLVSYSYYSSKK